MRIALGVAALVAVGAPASAAAQSYRTVVESRRLDRAEPLAVDVGFGVGKFRLAAGDRAELYRVGLTYLEDHFDPTVTYDARRGRLRIELGDSRESSLDLGNIEDNRQRLDLALSTEVPLDLHLRFGAIESDIALGGLAVRSATIETGASETVLSFSEPNKSACDALRLTVGAAQFEVIGLGNSRCRAVTLKGGVGQIVLDFTGAWAEGAEMRVSASVGLGEVRLRVPEDVGVRLEVSRFLAGLDLDGFTKRGSTYVSANYDRSPVKVRVDVNAAFGSIGVDWVR
jgi:hypothetical protein